MRSGWWPPSCSAPPRGSSSSGRSARAGGSAALYRRLRALRPAVPPLDGRPAAGARPRAAGPGGGWRGARSGLRRVLAMADRCSPSLPLLPWPAPYLSLTPSLIAGSPSPPEPHESGKAEGHGAEVRAEGGLAEGHRRLPEGHPARSSPGRGASPDLSLYNRVGDLYLKVNDTAAAVRSYERAVDLYADQGFFNNAIALCGKILRVNPGRTADLPQARPAPRPQEHGHRGQAEPDRVPRADERVGPARRGVRRRSRCSPTSSPAARRSG